MEGVGGLETGDEIEERRERRAGGSEGRGGATPGLSSIICPPRVYLRQDNKEGTGREKRR